MEPGSEGPRVPRSRSVEFFEAQFRRQIREGDFKLNPFETLALDYLRGDVLDLGCGLGNLALAAAAASRPSTVAPRPSSGSARWRAASTSR